MASHRYERRHATHDSDHRKEPQRDRDRIMFTVAIQRLAGVTQVASAVEGAAFHNRLTHTLEMSQLGRRLAEKVREETNESALEAIGGVDPDIVEAACLAHDIGHPPFGHTGEEALNDLLQRHGVKEGFEGNAQSLRIVARLEPYRPGFLGLNMTRATINALTKYPWTKTGCPQGTKKWGVYESDLETLQWARSGLWEGVQRSPEADIMDIADDIAYSVHDLHDFFKCHFIPLDRICEGGAEFGRFWKRAFFNWTGAPASMVENRDEQAKTFLAFLKQHANVDGQYQGTHSERARLREMTSGLIKRFRDSVQVNPAGSGLRIFVSQDAKDEMRLLRELTSVYVHRNSSLIGQRYGHRRVLDFLFGVFADHVQRGNLDVFPEQYREILESDEMLGCYCGTGGDEGALRVIADMICSMTDNQALSLHQRLSGFGPGQLVNQIID